MQKRFLQKCSLVAISSLMLMGLGCKKETMLGYDNASAIQTPYSLYAGNANGKIIHTNDGEKYEFIFPSDGYGPSHIAMANNNLLILKDILHYSRNEGKSFNPSNYDVRKYTWQNMIYYYAPFKRLYLTTNSENGIQYSEDGGETWEADIFEPNLPSLFEISSFAGLQNGTLYAYSNVSNILFYKSGKDLNWAPMTSIAAYPTVGSEYYLLSAGNSLYLVDYQGNGGAWMSSDQGVTWFKLEPNGVLPSGTKFTSAVAPTGNKVVVIATEDKGIFRSNEKGEFEATTGLPTGVKVNAMTKKMNIYKNGDVKIFLYVATDSGIYRSVDHGKSWFLSGDRNLVDNYKTIF
jgi:hypothetical protein